MKILKVLLSLTLIISTYFYKPLYVMIVALLFAPEHLFFLQYLYLYYSYKRLDRYSRLNLSISTDHSNIYQSWLDICKITAYVRIYLLLKPYKKINLRTIVKAILIITLQIPYKIIVLCKRFVQSPYTFSMTLILEKTSNFEVAKNLKIEFVNKKVTLNCLSQLWLFNFIIKRHPNKSVDEYVNMYKCLRQTWLSFHEHKMKYDAGQKIFKFGHIITHEKIKVPGIHYAAETLMFGEKCVMHATSTIPEILQPSQISGPAMGALLKPGSAKPGTIVSNGDYLYKAISRSDIRPIWNWSIWSFEYIVFANTSDSNAKPLLLEEFEAMCEVLEVENTIDGEIVHKIIMQHELNFLAPADESEEIIRLTFEKIIRDIT